MSSMPRPGMPPPMPVGIPMPPGSFVAGRMPIPNSINVPPGHPQFGGYHRHPSMGTPSMPPDIANISMPNPAGLIPGRTLSHQSTTEPTKPSLSQPASTPNASAPKKASAWSEHKAPDGRVYYYNSSTRQSAWTKPDELLTPAERLLAQCPWKEYQAGDSGKTYYHNVNTRESRWVMPKELEELKVRVAILESEASVGGVEGTQSSSGSSANAEIGQESAKKSALEQAMAATLAAIDIPPPGHGGGGGGGIAAEGSDEDSSGEESDSAEGSRKQGAPAKLPEVPAAPQPRRVFKDRREAVELFKDLLRDKKVPARSTWEQALRLIQPDPRYETLRGLSEKKQVFNQYKAQRFKEEKEEQRQRAKQARTDLEQFLMNGDRITSGTRYYKCEEMFGDMPVWKIVPDEERREIHSDVIFALASQEKENAKKLRRRNMQRLADILNSMTEITCDTTWQSAQQILLDNPNFAEDTNLLGMDKEDALIAFEEHIRQLEADVDEEKQAEDQRRTRLERKNRDAFILLLDQLHEQGRLTSMSLWVELYPAISADLRFTAMLGQPGSTPLDLFKFYVEDLKSRFHDEKKIIKEILKEKGFEVQVTTTFEEFATVVCEDRRSATMDAGNVKLTYNSLLEKAESRERERCKDDARKQRKLESAYSRMLRSAGVTHTDEWTTVRPKLENDAAFLAVELESERLRIFNDYQRNLVESCAHNHAKTHKKKKKGSSSGGSRKRRSRSKSRSRSDSRSRSRSRSADSSGGGGGRRKRRGRDKHRRSRSSSDSGGDGRGSDSGEARRRRHKASRRRRDSGSGNDR